MPERFDDRRALLLCIEEIAGRVARVERFEQQFDAGGEGTLAGPGEVGGINRGGGVVRQTLGRYTRDDMHPLASQRNGIIERLLDAVAERPSLAGHAGETALAGRAVAGP